MVRDDDAELYRKHADDLVALATTLAGPDAAADVVAAVVSRSISSPAWASVDNRHAYWVRSIYNEVRSRHRSAMRRQAREEADARRSGPAVIEGPDSDPSILAAVAGLSLRQRTVVYIAYWCDLPAADIAALLDISEGSVRRHLARARSKLRRTLS